MKKFNIQLGKSLLMVPALAFALMGTVQAADTAKGKKIVDANCAGCHSVGVMGAPKIGDNADWNKRLQQGYGILVDHAVNGKGNMPAKGGNPALSAGDIEDAVAYFLEAAKVKVSGKQATKPTVAKAAEAKPKKEVKAAPKADPKVAAAGKTAPAKKKTLKSNSFNRLMKSRADWNPPPAEDGIHDPENEDSYALQPPKEAFEGLPSNAFGNHIDWVKALEQGDINPRFDRMDPDKKPFVMDLNIVREVKGSMPNVVYPHKQHTEWLDCSNCHPAIFIPKKGANQISMASILLGEKCGVCHGKVAFPVSECRRCHSQKKK
ncbi:c(7)-type cytochrome triheme domain-containing protein [Aestuariirhabdus sp. LZHN29]|uniref:c(7)-type cytochrome triheme domain-containing protein n=1 Tax=Aestuariirhabdus sp. LZHN29 TaxID=3417462 RepID=UPI003CF6B19C